MVHSKGFFFSWTFETCLFKSLFRAKCDSQISHLNGFSPSWTQEICRSKSHFCLNLTSGQILHLYFGVLLLWTSATCRFKWHFCVYSRLHRKILHLYCSKVNSETQIINFLLLIMQPLTSPPSSAAPFSKSTTGKTEWRCYRCLRLPLLHRDLLCFYVSTGETAVGLPTLGAS